MAAWGGVSPEAQRISDRKVGELQVALRKVQRQSEHKHKSDGTAGRRLGLLEDKLDQVLHELSETTFVVASTDVAVKSKLEKFARTDKMMMF
jgi:hypothetical protein